MKQKFLAICLAAAALVPAIAGARENSTRDLSFFLRRLRTLDHLPVLESSHTAMSSTWDRGGAIADGADFKRIEVEPVKKLPADWGRFHATWRKKRAAEADAPRYGAQNLPVHTLLERAGAGKYVGTLLHVNWPSDLWWGEGDWLFWTDEEGWPPSYHGTGSEEYFNSGWGNFDRKAVSGYITRILGKPGEAAVYSFHLNDAFQFRKRIRVAVETVGFEREMKIINEQHPSWGSTAFWYAAQAMAADSTKTSHASPAKDERNPDARPTEQDSSRPAA